MPIKMTLREYEVLRMKINGASHKDIADKLCISYRTTKYHANQLFKRFGVKGAAPLIACFGHFELTVVWVPNPNAPKVTLAKARIHNLKEKKR